MECWWWFAECRFHPRTISIQDQFLFEVLVGSNHVSGCYQTVGTCIRKLVLYIKNGSFNYDCMRLDDSRSHTTVNHDVRLNQRLEIPHMRIN